MYYKPRRRSPSRRERDRDRNVYSRRLRSVSRTRHSYKRGSGHKKRSIDYRSEKHQSRRPRSSPRPVDFLPFFPRSASRDRHKKQRCNESPRSKAVAHIADSLFVGVTFLTSLDTTKLYDDGEMEDAVSAFVAERNKLVDTLVDICTELNLRSLVVSLDIVDAHVRALAGCVEQLKTYAKSPLFLSILRVLGHAYMFADLGCGSADAGSSEQMERLVLITEALVDKCNLAVKSAREWIVQACRRMCEAYICQARDLNAKVLHLVEKKQSQKKHDIESLAASTESRSV